ncbi:MAG TPA: MbnH family di-heme enzyme, partial [Vicinamibacterales bacterium]|nr:MbnH family di-heme enzyme [Vicinamibacterales bacterium]
MGLPPSGGRRGGLGPPGRWRRLVRGSVLGCVVATGCARPEAPVQPAAPPPYQCRLPRGFPQPEVPDDNPMTAGKVALGRRLFYDTRLSGNGTFSCASCHQQARAFTDGRPFAVGSTGQHHVRNTMSLANVAYNASFGWADPERRSLEAQMAVPMFNEHPVELGLRGREREVVARVAGNPADVDAFRAAFPGVEPAVSLDHIVKAIASFERTLVSGESPLDRYLYGDERGAMSPAALRGMKLFFSDRLRCAECHGTFNLSGPVVFEAGEAVEPSFHNTGLYDVDGAGGYPAVDRGLIDLTRRPDDMGRFRAPTLRNVAVTAPYMHDGSVPTLAAVVAHYASGGRRSPLRSPRVQGFSLSGTDAADLVAFLESLTDQAFLQDPALARPDAAGSGLAMTYDNAL